MHAFHLSATSPSTFLLPNLQIFFALSVHFRTVCTFRTVRTLRTVFICGLQLFKQ